MCCEYSPSTDSRRATASRPASPQSQRAQPAWTTARTSPALSTVNARAARSASGAIRPASARTIAAASPARIDCHQLLHFGHGRHTVQGAEARAAHRGGGVRHAQHLIDRLSLKKAVNEAAAKDVTGAGRVDGVDVKGGRPMKLVAGERHRAV